MNRLGSCQYSGQRETIGSLQVQVNTFQDNPIQEEFVLGSSVLMTRQAVPSLLSSLSFLSFSHSSFSIWRKHKTLKLQRAYFHHRHN